MDKIKLIAFVLIIITISIFLSYVFGRINEVVFWIWMIILAILSYKGIPFLRKSKHF